MSEPAQEPLEDDPVTEIILQRRNHGKIEPHKLPTEIRLPLTELLTAIRQYGVGLHAIQIRVYPQQVDEPPTFHVITEPTQEAVDRWLT